MARLIVEQKRKGVNLTLDENAALKGTAKELVEQKIKLSDILKQYQDLADTIQEAFTGAVRNIQTTFADFWYKLFNPEKGKKTVKDFLRSLADSFLNRYEGWNVGIRGVS